ncbi:MAG: FecR domain-containing protein [Rikenellaceae bacterium]|nr:FecR domain-containing protein [Rikenellaceae bacterium]MCL2693385.1 FecR domain-containing protein [Rikenellaceae bacterium]
MHNNNKGKRSPLIEPTRELNKKLSDWISSEKGENAIKTMIENRWNSHQDIIEGLNVETAFSKSLDKISDIPPPLKNHARVKNKPLRIVRWTAAVLIPLFIGISVWFALDRNIFGSDGKPISRIMTDATLTLPDGSVIILDKATENSRIAERDGIVFAREDGKLVYENKVAEMSDKIMWGTVDVPRGSQLELTLQDGSNVWLNAGSRLRFPIPFDGNERRVFLEGEAFFDVKKSIEKPFIVETADQELKVLGTEFNVYAYPQENSIHTALITGSVSLISKANQAQIILEPGQKATLHSDSGDYSITAVDTHEIMAWRNMEFVFGGATLDHVFTKLSRWYDFEYSFEDPQAAELTTWGSIPIYDDISSVLELIESLGKAKIITKGNKITVKLAK